MRDAASDSKPMSALLGDAFGHVQSLVRNEIDLAKAEAREALSRAVTGIALLIGALVIAICALNVLTVALVAWIAAGFGIATGWASLIVGVAYLVVVAIAVSIAVRKFKNIQLPPRRTVKNVQADARAIKESTHV